MSASISWLQLERFALGELSAADAALVRQQLAQNAELRARLAEIEAPTILRPLPVSLPRRRPSLWWGAPFAAALACLLWIMRPAVVDTSTPGVKGTAPEVSIVAHRDGQILAGIEAFGARDRLKVLLTCAAQQPVWVDVAIFQDDDAPDFLLSAPMQMACGNAIAIPGAFRLAAGAPAEICVLIDSPADMRARLRDGATVPDGTPCQTLRPLP